MCYECWEFITHYWIMQFWCDTFYAIFTITSILEYYIIINLMPRYIVMYCVTISQNLVILNGQICSFIYNSLHTHLIRLFTVGTFAWINCLHNCSHSKYVRHVKRQIVAHLTQIVYVQMTGIYALDFLYIFTTSALEFCFLAAASYFVLHFLFR